MKTILLVALIIKAIDGYNCDQTNDTDKFIRICRVEIETKRAFVDYLGNDNVKDVLFWKFLKARRERVALSKILGDIKCANEEWEDDKQMFLQLCSDETTLESCSSNQDESLKTKIDNMLKSAGWRRRKFADQLWFETHEKLDCLTSWGGTRALSFRYIDLEIRLKEMFQELCKEEALYDRVRHKISEATQSIKLDLTLTLLKEAKHQFDEVKEAREQFCKGPIESCCSEKQVEQGKAEASLRTAEILLKMVQGSAQLFRSMYEQEKISNQWEARFERACFIEHQTDLSSSSLSVRPNILAALHEQAIKVRTTLGNSLGEESCQLTHYPRTNTHGPNAIQQVKIDVSCESSKAKVMCRVLDNANDFQQFKYNKPLFQQGQAYWCAKARHSVNRKKSECSDQAIALVTDEALVEAQVWLELLELEDGSRRFDLLKEDMLKVSRDEFVALGKIRELSKKDLYEQTSEIGKEKSQQALQLISDASSQLWDKTTS